LMLPRFDAAFMISPLPPLPERFLLIFATWICRRRFDYAAVIFGIFAADRIRRRRRFLIRRRRCFAAAAIFAIFAFARPLFDAAASWLPIAFAVFLSDSFRRRCCQRRFRRRCFSF